YDGASGWFFLYGNPPAKSLTPGHAQIVRLLNLVRNNGDIREIEGVLKQDVALSFKLLRYINSAGFGLMVEIQSFRHAVSILGYDALNKWLSLLLVTASRDPSAPALMQTAIARGRFMEEIGGGFFDAVERDNLFITGAFSLLHTLLGTSIQTLLEEMNLPPRVSEALLYGQGDFAPFLHLAQCCESFDPKALQAAVDQLHLSCEQVNRAQLVGLGFADSLHG
ncbi:MAG TPA: HDOD domain-containing protein, partial [Thauera aminoaromatica]|nr:HDOD domain-containing protein [Thauera aminoaromatica]